MTKNVITVHPLDFVEEIAMLFYIHQIGSLPVVQDGQLVGMLTETDVLKTFVQLTGANQPGSQIEIRTKDTHGMLIEILKVIDQFQVNIQSVLLYPDKADPSKKLLFYA